jgi:hypothetical protein
MTIRDIEVTLKEATVALRTKDLEELRSVADEMLGRIRRGESDVLEPFFIVVAALPSKMRMEEYEHAVNYTPPDSPVHLKAEQKLEEVLRQEKASRPAQIAEFVKRHRHIALVS